MTVYEKSQRVDWNGLELECDVITSKGVAVSVEASPVAAGVADIDSSHALEVEINGTTYFIPLSTVVTFDTEA